MKVKNNKILLPAVAVAVLVLGGGYYGTQLINKQNDFSKAAAYTSAINPVDPSTAPDSYEIKFADENFKRALNSILMKSDPSRTLNSPITAGVAKTMTSFWPNDPYRNFENIEGIQYFTNLTTIHLAAVQKLKDISPAENLTKISEAYLSGTGIEDISAIKNWKNVGTLWVHDSKIVDFSPLKDLPKANVWGIRTGAKIQVSKGQRIFKNPFINFDGTIMPIEENANFINTDKDGNPQQDGGYIKITPNKLKGDNYRFQVHNKKEAMLNGNKFNNSYNSAYNKSGIIVDGIDVSSEEKPDIYFSIQGHNILLKEDSPLVWNQPRQNNSTINNAIINSFKKNYNPQAGGILFTASSSTSNITAFTSDAEEVFENKENQLNGDYLVTVKATNEFGNTTTAQFRLLVAVISRETAKKALENFENQPDYIKNAVPADLVNEAKRVTTQPFGISDADVKSVADALNAKIDEINTQENERKTDVSNTINELKKQIEDIADFKDVLAENDKILNPTVKQANLDELNKIAERYTKNSEKLEQTLDKIADLKNLDKISKETLAKLQDVVQAAANLTISTQLNTAEKIKNSTENLASESEILKAISELENAVNGLRLNKTELNKQLSAFEKLPEWLKKELDKEAEKAKLIQKEENPSLEEIKKATEDLKSAVEKAQKAEESRQKAAETAIQEAQEIIKDNEAKKDELPAVDVEKLEDLISKVKDEQKRKELSEKLQEIKDSVKKKEAKIEADKLEEDRKKRNEEIAKQRLNSPETGYLREKQNQQNEAAVPVLIGLIAAIFAPVVVFFAKKFKKNSKKI